MVLNSNLIGFPVEGNLDIPANGILKVEVSYKIPTRSRKSTTTFLFRVAPQLGEGAGFWQGLSDIRVPVLAREPAPSQEQVALRDAAVTARNLWITTNVYGGNQNTNVPYFVMADDNRLVVRMSYTALGEWLNKTFFLFIRGFQSEEVLYKTVRINVFNTINWGLQSNIGTIPNGNSLLTGILKKKFLCGTSCTGTNSKSKFSNSASLTFDAYFESGENANGFEKPGRVLILGTVFKNQKEVLASSAIETLMDNMKNGYRQARVEPTATIPGVNSIHFIPVFPLKNIFYPVAAVQLEGLQNVAGAKARELEATNQNLSFPFRYPQNFMRNDNGSDEDG
jgi:hypothetical protein